MNTKDKIKSREELEETVYRIRQKPESKIVTTNGCFDILHPGHIYVFEQARYYGGYLIVGVNSDNSVRQNKGQNRPINNESHRAMLIAALVSVDYVTMFEEPTPIEFLELVKPDFHVKSKTGFKGIETKVVEDNGGKIILLDDIDGMSTTKIIEKILKGNLPNF